jgi:glycosyltransferase involved in cell wall biosynthesis
LKNCWIVQREKFDLLLTVDYNISHTVYLRSAPRTPAVIWVRDPRTPDDVRKVESLRVPGAESERPQGLHCMDATSMAAIARESAWMHRPLLFASTAPSLVSKLPETYGVEPWTFYLLPNMVERPSVDVRKSERPLAVFLGRLDPIKRPWIFAELARRFPSVRFAFLGQPHFTGPGAWKPNNLPDNIEMLGHVDGETKAELLCSAWVLINTSIHEGLAISFLEALAHGTPLLSCQNTGSLVSRFGIYTGRFDGDGMQGLDAFTEGLTRLIDDSEVRASKGEQGRDWVRAVHNNECFLEAFTRLLTVAGVRA